MRLAEKYHDGETATIVVGIDFQNRILQNWMPRDSEAELSLRMLPIGLRHRKGSISLHECLDSVLRGV